MWISYLIQTPENVLIREYLNTKKLTSIQLVLDKANCTYLLIAFKKKIQEETDQIVLFRATREEVALHIDDAIHKALQNKQSMFDLTVEVDDFLARNPKLATNPLQVFKLSSELIECLENNKIDCIEALLQLKEEQIEELPNMSDEFMTELKNKLAEFKITLRSDKVIEIQKTYNPI